LRQPHLQRIVFDITRRRPKILFVLHHAREKTVLPDAAGLVPLAVEVLCA
jgi:hypothetical protein